MTWHDKDYYYHTPNGPGKGIVDEIERELEHGQMEEEIFRHEVVELYRENCDKDYVHPTEKNTLLP